MSGVVDLEDFLIVQIKELKTLFEVNNTDVQKVKEVQNKTIEVVSNIKPEILQYLGLDELKIDSTEITKIVNEIDNKIKEKNVSQRSTSNETVRIFKQRMEALFEQQVYSTVHSSINNVPTLINTKQRIAIATGASAESSLSSLLSDDTINLVAFYMIAFMPMIMKYLMNDIAQKIFDKKNKTRKLITICAIFAYAYCVLYGGTRHARLYTQAKIKEIDHVILEVESNTSLKDALAGIAQHCLTKIGVEGLQFHTQLRSLSQSYTQAFGSNLYNDFSERSQDLVRFIRNSRFAQSESFQALADHIDTTENFMSLPTVQNAMHEGAKMHWQKEEFNISDQKATAYACMATSVLCFALVCFQKDANGTNVTILSTPVTPRNKTVRQKIIDAFTPTRRQMIFKAIRAAVWISILANVHDKLTTPLRLLGHSRSESNFLQHVLYKHHQNKEVKKIG